MEHYRSTLATTAIAVFALVTAAHVLHPGNYEVQTRPARTAAAVDPVVDPVAVAWIDPPARIGAPETTGTIRPNGRAAEATAALSTPPVPTEVAHKAGAARRTRLAERGLHRGARSRHAALARSAQADRTPAAPPAQPAPEASAKIDPIGDIIRGLGLGRDG